MTGLLITRVALGFGLLAVGAQAALAQQSVEKFYAGNTVRIIVGYPPGSTFDTYSRTLSRHYSRHIPGEPTIIIQNMPGAGSLTATNYLANVAPKDGSVLGMPNPVNTVEPLLNPKSAKFDPRRFSWIGSMNSERSTCAFWGGKIKTLDDLGSKQAIVGSTGPSSGSTIDAKVLSSIFDFNFKIVTGYPGLNEVRLAAQQGEADGHCGLVVSSLKTDLWSDFKNGKVNVPIQMGLDKHPDLPNIPNAFDLAKTDSDRQVLLLTFGPWKYGRPLMGPAGIPQERLEALRTGFDETLKDKAFLADAKKLNLEVQPLGPEDIQTLVEEIYKTPTPVVERTRKILGIQQ